MAYKAKEPYFLNVNKRDFNFMGDMFRQGMSANNVQKLMSDYGLGYRRQTVLAVRRKVLDMMKKENLWESLPENKIPTKGYFNEVNYSAPFRYWIHYDVIGIDSETGQEKTFTLSAFANEAYDKETMSNEILNQLNPDYYKEVFSFSNVTIRSVDHKSGLSY